ncbi:MAG: enoyl-CoA hydratase/isomerase family protein [Nitrospinales bacterium]
MNYTDEFGEIDKQFLNVLFEKTGGNPAEKASMYTVGIDLGLDREKSKDVAGHLIGSELIEIRTLAGDISLTTAGVDQVKKEGKLSTVSDGISYESSNGQMKGATLEKISIEDRSGVAVLRLTNGVTNAISPELVKDLSIAIIQIRNEFQGMVFAGGSRFFSIGLNLPELLQLDRKSMTEFWYDFDQVVFKLFTLPLPTACAIAGHAIAGGTILALTCDFRLATTEKKLLGLNEIKLGIPVPYLADLILRQTVGDRFATELLYRGNFINTDKALEMGLVDLLQQSENLEELAVEQIAEIAEHPQPAFTDIKLNRLEAIRLRYEKNNWSKNEEFLNRWFSRTVQKRLAIAAEKF